MGFSKFTFLICCDKYPTTSYLVMSHENLKSEFEFVKLELLGDLDEL